MDFYLFLIAIHLFFAQSFGLKCWTCQNAKTNAECKQRGALKTCEESQGFCQNSVRKIPGVGRQITKQCATEPECRNFEKQIIATLSRVQCADDDGESICRCCCSKDNCNALWFKCEEVRTCRRPRNPENGIIICPARQVKIGGTCRVRCNPGFAPDRKNIIRCIQGEPAPRFTNFGAVKCIRRQPRCSPMTKKMPMGVIKCQNAKPYARMAAKNFEGTICNFTCLKNSFRSGSSQATCRRGYWSHGVPICKPGRCRMPPRDETSFVRCNNRNLFGSRCVFDCIPGYKIVGTWSSTCGPSKIDPRRGVWSNGIPKCKLVQCPLPVVPSNGEIVTTNDNFEWSVAIHTCKPGYDMDGTTAEEVETTCEDDGTGIGKWVGGPIPGCSQILCQPLLKNPVNGYVVCSDENRWNSACSFRCNIGYDLDGTSSDNMRSFCEMGRNGDAVGEWSDEPPTCSPIRCTIPRKAPVNGYMTCSNHNFAGSVCTFRCERGYDLDKTEKRFYKNTCLDTGMGTSGGEWDDLPPTCRKRIYCRERLVAPQNGDVECSDQNFIGSSCKFSCNEGYRLQGKVFSNCVELLEDGDEIAEWTGKPPKCIARYCAAPWFDSKLVKQDCIGMRSNLKSYFLIGTSCRYSCKNDGYYTIRQKGQIGHQGTVISKCLNSLRWSEAPPRCFIKTCPHIRTPQHGYEPECTKGNRFGSTCDFWCKYPYKLTHKLPLVCTNNGRSGATGKWNRQPPSCKLVK